MTSTKILFLLTPARLKSLIIITFSVVLNTSLLTAQNVLISDVGNPCEPAIMMDPLNTNVLVAGSNLNYVYRSTNGGLSWTVDTLESSYGVWGDPVIDVDADGNFYFTHLSNTPGGSWIDRIVCQKSSDQGQSWNNGSFTGLNGGKPQDKQWTCIDRKKDIIYMTWTQFDDYGSADPQDSSIILFSKSTDGGVNWSNPLRLNTIAGDCIDSDNTVEGATPAVGPNGEVYVAWAGPSGLTFQRSEDEGQTWLNKELFIDSIRGGWDQIVPGLYRCNGLPILKCDTSNGPNHGTLYLCWSANRPGYIDTDIFLSSSTDKGNTWSDPIMVNTDTGRTFQFLPWIDIDQTNGYLYFVYYDRSAYPGNPPPGFPSTDPRTDVVMARSMNGGKTFERRFISDSSFAPFPSVFFGDYTNITVHDNVVRPIWARMDNGKLSIWTNISPVDSLFTSVRKHPKISDQEIKQYPNPTKGMTYTSFKLHGQSTVSIYVLDEMGRIVQKVYENKSMDYGKYVVPIDLSKTIASDGQYFIQLIIDGESKTSKVILVE